MRSLLDFILCASYEGGNFIVRENGIPMVKKFLDASKRGHRILEVNHNEEEEGNLRLYST